MATSKGGDQVRRFIAQLPDKLEKTVLRGAARAAGKVVAEEAKARSVSDEVSDAISVVTKAQPGLVVAKVQVKGPGAYKAPWLEYGTDPHFITVDDSQRQGMSASRINKLGKAGTLVINGEAVGTTVFHPGARPHPFLRPALDTKEAEAIAAAQSYINARVSRSGVTGSAEEEGE